MINNLWMEVPVIDGSKLLTQTLLVSIGFEVIMMEHNTIFRRFNFNPINSIIIFILIMQTHIILVTILSLQPSAKLILLKFMIVYAHLS